MWRRIFGRPDFWKVAYLDAAIIGILVLMATNADSLDAFHVVFWLMIAETFFLKRWGFWGRLLIAVTAVEYLILHSPEPDWRDVIEPFALVGITITVFVLHTTRDRARQALRELATTDPLTGVLNRRAFQARLDEAVATLARYGTTFAVAYLDLDGFKSVNDRHGHDVGDAVLAQTAARIDHEIRETDFVGRIGGDEFAILLTNTTSREAVEAIARRLTETLRKPFFTERAKVDVSASTGIVVADASDERLGVKLLADADHAMYEAKRTNRGNYALVQ